MRISHLEIANFRKLVAVRVDLAPDKTVFVGANNSGKTSAMTVLRRFLVDPKGFNVNDVSLGHWRAINDLGAAWEAAFKADGDLPSADLSAFLPQLDLWLEVNKGEMHHVQRLLPSLDWTSGALGVRLRYAPDEPERLQQDYLAIRAKSAETLHAAALGEGLVSTLELWPQSLMDFLERRLSSYCKVKAYILDPAGLVQPQDGAARPQFLPEGAEPLDGNPLSGLIRVDEISAQRGFGVSAPTRPGETGTSEARPGGRRLSGQLRSYYDSHLDWQDTPNVSDLTALAALEAARKEFDKRLDECFAKALTELTRLGYPGVSDPQLKIATRLRLQDGLNHDSAVQYAVGDAGGSHRLPEDSNGLGYQNLVSMVFALMGYRDAWMKVGKPGLVDHPTPPEPLHLVLVEEPEAYLHAQVQQVFIKHAFEVLRNLPALGAATAFTTQLLVSTHSSHVAHACDFAALRYFRRLPADAGVPIPTACVVNLSTVFGDKTDQTARFVTRYLKATHCDLFFADGAVFIEGAAERILTPHFVEERAEFEYLRSAYISWLEIGGSHAHRFRALVEHLGLTTLIITDLDAKDPLTGKAAPPERSKGQEARNATLRTWVPGETSVDVLLDLDEALKALPHPSGYGVRAAYQIPVAVRFPVSAEGFHADQDDCRDHLDDRQQDGVDGGRNAAPVELLANTFEDAVLYANIAFFTARARQGVNATGLAADFQAAAVTAQSAEELAGKAREAIRDGAKAEFALDLLYSEDVNTLVPPEYIRQGLLWLIAQLKRKEDELAPKVAAA